MSKTALIVGASGLVGSHCLDYLLSSECYIKVYAFVRSPLAITHEKLETFTVDLDTVTSFGFPIDDVFCCLGTTIKKAGSQEAFRTVDYVYPIRVAAAALNDGATQFMLISALGADTNSIMFYSRIKGAVERDIQNLEYETFYAIRPSLLLGDRTEKRLGEDVGKFIVEKFPFLFVGPLQKYKAVHAKEVACCMVHAAQRGERGNFIIESKDIRTFNL